MMTVLQLWRIVGRGVPRGIWYGVYPHLWMDYRQTGIYHDVLWPSTLLWNTSPHYHQRDFAEMNELLVCL